MKLFHCDTAVIRARVTRIGRLAGSTTCTMTSMVVAPSIRAALMRSVGMVRKYSRSRKIAYGEPNMNGSTKAQNVFRRPTWAIIRYSGTTVTVAGTISVATYTQNSTSRTGNSIRAKAYAANTEKVSCPSRMTAVISAVTTIALPNPASPRPRQFANGGGDGTDSGDSVLNCCAEVNDVNRPSPNGTSVITARTARAREIAAFE